jgi:hypothetical protein
MWDVVVSHVSADEHDIARPLGDALAAAGFRVNVDQQSVRPGDSLLERVLEGLAHAPVGIVVVSPRLLSDDSLVHDLERLFSHDGANTKVILQVWHELDRPLVDARSPLLASQFSVSTAEGVQHVVHHVLRIISPVVPDEPSPLRFIDALNADSRSAIDAVAAVLGDAAATVTVEWPQAFDRLLRDVEDLLEQAKQHERRGSPFHHCPPKHIANFVSTASSAVSSARRLRINIPNRVPR